MKLKLGDFLRRRKDAVDVTDGVKYKRATIRINHKGISIRDEKDGTQIKTKRQFSISKGQFLLSKIDARNGAFGIVPDELDKGIITGNFWTFDVDQSKVLIAFFKAFTESATFTDICIRSSSGTTNRKYLDEKKFLEIEIEVPDIEKQTVVISNYHQKKEAIKKLQDFGVNQREILSNLRQSILQEAVQGKLTKKWRANNPNTEPASELLKRIEAEKQQLIAEKKIKKEKPLPPINEDEIPYELPKGWVWCRLGAISKQITDGEHQTPPRIPEGRRLLSAKNVRDGFIDYENCDYISEEHYQKSIKRCNPEIGDLLIVSVGGTIGRISMIEKDIPFALVRSVAMVKNLRLIPNYLRWVMNSPLLQDSVESRKRGGAQPCLYLGEIKEFMFPLAPLKEQHAIVEKVSSLMALCDELEQQIETSNIQIEQLMQSCLKEVFEH